MDRYFVTLLIFFGVLAYYGNQKEGLLGSIPPISEQEMEVHKFNNPNLIVAPRTTESVEATRSVLIDLNTPEPRHRYYEEDEEKMDRVASTIVRGLNCRTKLTEKYFSRKNIDKVHDMIIDEVFQRSEGRFKIDRQDDNDVIIIMRSIYAQYGRNLPTKIDEQIAELNRITVTDAVPRIMSEISQYRTYVRQNGRIPEPIVRPVNLSSKGSKTLRSVTSLWT